jgi:hypothetical protein
MDANQFVVVHGMHQTRSILERWGDDPWPVLRTWLLGAVLIALCLLGGVTLTASLVKPDYGFHYGPTAPGGPVPLDVLEVLARNSLVLALHAFACVAGFIAGATLPQTASTKTGFKRVIHEKARPVGATIAWDEHISAPLLVLTAFPHALLELTAVFLPLAAWTIASRRGEWDQLLAATFVTVAMAIPMLIVAATWEVYVWPYILQSVSP